MLNKPEDSRARVLVTLVGDPVHDLQSHIKYGTFFDALAKRFTIIDVCDATLRGVHWWVNALMTWHPDKRQWRERSVKSIYAFSARSRRIASWARSMQGRADAVLQLGVLFNAGWGGVPMKHIVYTDYTAQLSAQQPAGGRSPFNPRTLRHWLTLEQKAMFDATHVCVRSELVRQSILKDYGLPAERVSMIGGGANLEKLPPLAGRKESSGNPTVLFIGMDFYRKGGDLVLMAFARTRAQFPNAKLLFLSKGPIPKEMPIDGVELIEPVWRREEVLKLYERADVFVMPSRLETWGDVFLEAMAYGLPCVGVHGQAMAEIIRHAETGFLVPPDAVDPLADRLIELLADPEKRIRMGMAGRRRVELEFTWDRVVERLAPVINAK